MGLFGIYFLDTLCTFFTVEFSFVFAGSRSSLFCLGSLAAALCSFSFGILFISLSFFSAWIFALSVELVLSLLLSSTYHTFCHCHNDLVYSENSLLRYHTLGRCILPYPT